MGGRGDQGTFQGDARSERGRRGRQGSARRRIACGGAHLNVSVERRIFVGFLLALALFAALAITAVRTVRDLVETDHRVDHTSDVLLQLATILATASDARAAARGFVITGDEQFLGPYDAGVARMAGDLDRLGRSFADDRDQERRLRSLREVLVGMFAILDEVVALRRTNGFPAAQAVIAGGRGKEAMDEVRRTIGEMVEEERRLLAERRAAEGASGRATAAVFSGTALFVIVLMAASFWGIRRDLAERRRLAAELERARDAALEAARLKSEFVANMSHEIRTPMNAVIGMSTLLLETSLNQEQREFASIISTSAESLLGVVNDVLDFSKIEAGKLRLEMIDFDLYEVIEGTTALMAERAQAKGLELGTFIEPETPSAVRGDPMRLRQVLVNLLANAVKFTEQGGVTLRVALRERGRDQTVLRFAVEDTGIGLSEPERANLFQPFAQADGATTRRYGGTGLGLAISKQLVTRMGGEIGVESRPGEGSTFWFTARFEKQAASEAKAGESPTQLHGLRILIVDARDASRNVLVEQLSAWGVSHRHADSGARALEVLRAAAVLGEPFHAVLLSERVRGQSSIEILRLLRAEAGIGSVPMIVVGSRGLTKEREAAAEAGASAYLTRPIRPSEFFDVLVTSIASRERPAPAREPEPPPTGADRQTRPAALHPTRILVAEDNAVNRTVAARLLERLGYRADAVTNGAEAVRAAASGAYDLVLMDCQTPEMDGYQATAQIRAGESPGRRLPIIAMTAHVLEGDRERCLAAGMDDYLAKPVQIEELGRILERWRPASDEPSSRPPVDLARLRAIVDEGDELRELARLYLSETAGDLERVDAALRANDARELCTAAHRAAGSSANCGAGELARLFGELEQLGVEGDLARAKAAADAILGEHARVAEYLREQLRLSA